MKHMKLHSRYSLWLHASAVSSSIFLASNRMFSFILDGRHSLYLLLSLNLPCPVVSLYIHAVLLQISAGRSVRLADKLADIRQSADLWSKQCVWCVAPEPPSHSSMKVTALWQQGEPKFSRSTCLKRKNYCFCKMYKISCCLCSFHHNMKSLFSYSGCFARLIFHQEGVITFYMWSSIFQIIFTLYEAEWKKINMLYKSNYN